MENFEHSLTAGNMKSAMKDAGAVSADLWQVAPDKLRVLAGFNPRVKNAAYVARVRGIADSIIANGYYKHKPISGFVAREDGADIIYVTGGHRRHEAVLLAISEGAAIQVVPVIVSPKGTNMEDLTVALHVDNTDEAFSMYEAAILCKRLAGFGWTSERIATRMGYSTPQYVDGLLILAGAPLPIRRMVEEDITSATAAIDAIRRYGDKAHEILLAALVKAGGGRVTAKHMPNTTFTRMLRKQAEPMHAVLLRVQNDPGFSALSPDTLSMVMNLLEEMQK